MHNKPFAPLTLDFMFKRAFATEKNKHILISLINSFLSEKMENPLKEVLLINTVQPPKTGEHRGAIFDLHCEDTLGNRFIVEMQLAGQMHFIERTLLYISHAIVNVAKKGGEYDYSLPRIYSLSFLDFVPRDIGEVGDGSEESVQYISLANDKHPEIRYKYISVALAMLPMFTKTAEQCSTIQDWWLYLFNNMHELDDIPPELLRLSEKAFKDLFETAKIARFTKEELFDYEAKMKYWNDSKAIMDYAETTGFEKGRDEGIGIGIVETAKSMLKEGLDIALIARITKLSQKEIGQL
jgi:predicted transposase/invertase (TIGR01784 family)